MKLAKEASYFLLLMELIEKVTFLAILVLASAAVG